MRKVFRISIALIIIDQILRFYAQYNLFDKRIGNKYFGFTYRVNYGLYVYQDAPKYLLILLAIIFLFLLFFSYFAYLYFCTQIRKSTLIDISYACFIAAVLGNVYIDRIAFGYIRDYIVTPIAIANLADLLINFAIILLFLEMIIHKESRKLLRINCNVGNVKKFFQYIKNRLRQNDSL